MNVKGLEANYLVFFKYERLPNICYHCGCFGHGEKECQYTNWLRAYGDKDKKGSQCHKPSTVESQAYDPDNKVVGDDSGSPVETESTFQGVATIKPPIMEVMESGPLKLGVFKIQDLGKKVGMEGVEDTIKINLSNCATKDPLIGDFQMVEGKSSKQILNSFGTNLLDYPNVLSPCPGLDISSPSPLIAKAHIDMSCD
ncbi:unnamed protein product [Ilex paraguariensis]|uniref:CCHC-type domain-containing protein n=1 Tax=Ilex paraguariensis TaxID=185542 RepID=A0ABC8R7K0_9AQUA